MWPFNRKPSASSSSDNSDAQELDAEDDVATLAPVKPYVNDLIMAMIKSRRLETTLSEVKQLPPYRDGQVEPPSFASVSNRLKVMANLNPVLFVKPQEGAIELTIDGKPFTIDVRFEDAGDRQLRIHIVEGLRVKPPRKPLV